MSQQNELTGMELIVQTKDLFADLLYHFRECHDLCSKVFKKEVILQIDACAITFRQLGLDTVSVARIVADQWLDSIISFFENIKVIGPQGMTETLILLGGQAREIGLMFKVIAAWARDLGGKFHKAQDATITEAEEFKAAFAKPVRQTEAEKQEIKRLTDKREKLRKDAEDIEGKWKVARIAFGWNPVGLVVTRIGATISGKAAAEANKLEQEAKEKLHAAMENLDKRKKDHEKAKFIASKAAVLVKLLGSVDKTCEAIGAFWTMEADKFVSQGGKMKTNHAKLPAGLTDVVANDNIKIWKEAKGDLKAYIKAMTTIGNCFNFATEAQLPPMTPFHLANLDFTLHIPSTINTNAITAA